MIGLAGFGPGKVRSVDPPRPAAGAEIEILVPAGRVWVAHALRLELVTDATAANRFVFPLLSDGNNEFWRFTGAPAQAASLTRQYLLAPEHQFVQTAFAGTGLMIPLPRIPLVAGWKIQTVTTAIQAGDRYAQPRLIVTEYIDRGEPAQEEE